MAHPSGAVPPAGYGRWPVTSDPGPLTVTRADPLAAVLLVLAGLAALLSWVLELFPVGSGGVADSGATVFSLATAHGPISSDITALCLVSVAVGGGALVLLGLAALLPINHRPFGVGALLVSLAVTGAAIWLLAKATDVLGSADLLSGSHPAWYLIATAAVLGLVGAVRAMVAG